MRLEKIDSQYKGIKDAVTYELLDKKEQMLPFLQTLFVEERLIEIQVDQGTRLFFGALWDRLPDLEEEELDGDLGLIELAARFHRNRPFRAKLPKGLDLIVQICHHCHQ